MLPFLCAEQHQHVFVVCYYYENVQGAPRKYALKCFHPKPIHIDMVIIPVTMCLEPDGYFSVPEEQHKICRDNLDGLVELP